MGLTDKLKLYMLTRKIPTMTYIAFWLGLVFSYFKPKSIGYICFAYPFMILIMEFCMYSVKQSIIFSENALADAEKKKKNEGETKNE